MFMGSLVSLKIGKKYDYIFGFQVGPLTAMVPAIILKQFYKKPVTLWIQDIWPDSVYAYGFKKTKILEKRLECTISDETYEEVKNEIEKILPNKDSVPQSKKRL